MNSQAARFFIYEKCFKSWKKAEKRVKSREKNFCLGASTWRKEMPLIKVAYFMLNILNLKSFLSHFFFLVASCLSTLLTVIFLISIIILGYYKLIQAPPLIFSVLNKTKRKKTYYCTRKHENQKKMLKILLCNVFKVDKIEKKSSEVLCMSL